MQGLRRGEFHELGCRLLERSTSRQETRDDAGEEGKGHIDGDMGVAKEERESGLIII